MLVSTGKAMEGLAGWRANTHYKGKQQEPMGLTPRGEAEELRSGPALLTQDCHQAVFPNSLSICPLPTQMSEQCSSQDSLCNGQLDMGLL